MAEPTRRLPKTIDVTIEYLRPGRGGLTAYARADLRKVGRRIANVHVEAWQDDRSRPFAALRGHFLLSGEGAPPVIPRCPKRVIPGPAGQIRSRGEPLGFGSRRLFLPDLSDRRSSLGDARRVTLGLGRHELAGGLHLAHGQEVGVVGMFEGAGLDALQD